MTTIDESSRLENTQPAQRAREAEGVPVTSSSVVPPDAVRPENSFNAVLAQLVKPSNPVL